MLLWSLAELAHKSLATGRESTVWVTYRYFEKFDLGEAPRIFHEDTQIEVLIARILARDVKTTAIFPKDFSVSYTGPYLIAQIRIRVEPLIKL